MKKLVLLVAVFLITLSLTAQKSKSMAMVDNSNAGIFEFDSETVDYGTINQNAKGDRTFSFKNTGNSPIIISKVKASCGCTVPTKPNQPIMPGESGKIGVKYDTKRIGAFSKTITITSNASETSKRIRIKGIILKNDNVVSSK